MAVFTISLRNKLKFIEKCWKENRWFEKYFSRWERCRWPFFSIPSQSQALNNQSSHNTQMNTNQISVSFTYMRISARNWEGITKNCQQHRSQREKYFSNHLFSFQHFSMNFNLLRSVLGKWWRVKLVTLSLIFICSLNPFHLLPIILYFMQPWYYLRAWYRLTRRTWNADFLLLSEGLSHYWPRAREEGSYTKRPPRCYLGGRLISLAFNFCSQVLGVEAFRRSTVI